MVDGGWSDAANLGQPGDRLRRRARQPAAMRGKEDLVVRDQPREEAMRPAMAYKGESKLRLARAGFAGDHNAAIPEHQRGAMEVERQLSSLRAA